MGIELSFDSATPHFEIFSKGPKTKWRKDICDLIFLAALSTTAYQETIPASKNIWLDRETIVHMHNEISYY